MKLDFTQNIYQSILEELLNAGYKFQAYEDFHKFPISKKTVILRHDVDRTPGNAIIMAKIEEALKIRASYYFRVVSESYDENCIREILKLNHELGYHYEDLALSKGNVEKAIESFVLNLEKFRKFYPVSTMCMHGSPMSKYDNRDLWKSFKYKDYGIIAEPYFDLDFNAVFYITDASRTWNNEKVTVRDKVKSDFNIPLASGNDIIKHIKKGTMPDKLMLSTHPHNWSDSLPEWIKIKVWQGIKNQIKRIIVSKS